MNKHQKVNKINSAYMKSRLKLKRHKFIFDRNETDAE